jgi:hypothetical protein
MVQRTKEKPMNASRPEWTFPAPRVKVLSADPPLPPDIRTAIAGRAAWLRDELPRLDAQLGVCYPPVEIVPVFWRHTLLDGTPGAISGRLTVVSTEAVRYYAVQVTAPYLLEADDDLVRGVLAHEFEHYVHNTLETHRRSRAGEREVIDFAASKRDYQPSRAHYQQIDRARRRTECLPDALRTLKAQAGNDRDSVVTRVWAAVWANWVKAGLPTEQQVNLDVQRGSPITLDKCVIERFSSEQRTKGGK